MCLIPNFTQKLRSEGPIITDVETTACEANKTDRCGAVSSLKGQDHSVCICPSLIPSNIPQLFYNGKCLLLSCINQITSDEGKKTFESTKHYKIYWSSTSLQYFLVSCVKVPQGCQSSDMLLIALCMSECS